MALLHHRAVGDPLLAECQLEYSVAEFDEHYEDQPVGVGGDHPGGDQRFAGPVGEDLAAPVNLARDGGGVPAAEPQLQRTWMRLEVRDVQLELVADQLLD